MARTTTVTVKSDLTGDNIPEDGAAQSLTFPRVVEVKDDAGKTELAIQYVTYRFDSTDDEAIAWLRDEVYASGSDVILESDTVTTKVKGETAPAGDQDREQNKAIREWAKGQGFELKDRGRIPAKVQEAYDEAHPVQA